MNMRVAFLGAATLLAVVAGGTAAWWRVDAETPDTVGAQPAGSGDTNLPIPPVPPRVAQGDAYETCLAMIPEDPAGASAYAQTWQAAGGGEGAAHCFALARIAAGQAETGAEMLESLASQSNAPAAARASVYSQAGQAWLMVGNGQRAFGAATLALALSPDDPDLLIDHAVAAANLDRFQEALDDLSHALDIDPKRTDAMVLRGSAWRHLGRLELAQDDIDRALLADPDNADALLERGILRQRHNDRAGARADWERAASLAPDSATGDLAQQNLALLEAGPDRR